MNKKRDFFGEVFQEKTTEDTRTLYDDWANNYEKAHQDMGGYLAPQRCAAALAEFVTDRSEAVIDIGCGTGLAAVAIRELGFTQIDGTDLSEGMLRKAAEREGLYRNLFPGDLNQPLPVTPGSIQHAIAAGVLSPAHAPASTLTSVLELLPAGGCFSFSLNDHSLADPSYQAAIDSAINSNLARQLFWQHGTNVPGTKLNTTVVVLQRC